MKVTKESCRFLNEGTFELGAMAASGSSQDALLMSMKMCASKLDDEIMELEARVERARCRRDERDSEERSSNAEEAPNPGETLRERRLHSGAEVPLVPPPARLVVDLTAGSQHDSLSQSETAFFSPSCHDWSQEKLLTSDAWTPFQSPRRSPGTAAHSRWPAKHKCSASGLHRVVYERSG